MTEEGRGQDAFSTVTAPQDSYSQRAGLSSSKRVLQVPVSFQQQENMISSHLATLERVKLPSGSPWELLSPSLTRKGSSVAREYNKPDFARAIFHLRSKPSSFKSFRKIQFYTIAMPLEVILVKLLKQAPEETEDLAQMVISISESFF